MRIVAGFIISIFFAIGLFVMSPKQAAASEGQFELANTVGENTRCYALSVLLQNGTYNVVVTCRNLIYPSDENNSMYILWSRNGNDIVKLGSLALGKASFNTKTAFNQLFVTLEVTDRVNEPSNRVVMRGNLRDIAFLAEVATPTPTVARNANATITESQPEDLGNPPVIPALTTREKLLIGLKRSSVIAGAALLGLIGLIFVITRSRG